MKIYARLFRLFTLSLALFGIMSLSGCASYYVDNATKEVSVSTYKKPAEPKPVQVVFEFQTKGVANATATGYLAPIVMEEIKASGLFSKVDNAPVEGGVLLDVVINNVPLSDDAFRKGFVTGLTLGLAGSQVGDGYICTMKYLPGNRSPAVVETAHHAIYTVIGAKSAPENGTKMDNLDMAVKTMTKQIVSTTLNELSHNPEFQ